MNGIEKRCVAYGGKVSQDRGVGFFRWGMFLAAAACVFLAIGAAALPGQAFANRTLEAPMTVSDDVTRVSVGKFDAATHEFVVGAHLAIVEKATGAVADDWKTEKTLHETTKVLDVDKAYVLREIEAPSGYQKAKDVEFVVNAVEGEGVTIVSADAKECELVDPYTLSLYDAKAPVEKVVTKTRPQNRATSSASPQTGDRTPLAVVGGLAALALVAIVILRIAKRKM